MPRKEKFGKFVLLEPLETSGLGQEYRAAKLSPAGLEKIVSLLRLKPALSANTEAVKGLMDQVKFAAQLQNPNLLKIFGIGKVDASYYVSYEFLEGKSLRTVFNRTRQDRFPFSVDHALLIASKACTALEYAHSRKTENGSRYFHGFIPPASVVLSYEGEVRLRGLAVWPSRIREAGGTLPEEETYLSPEQAAGGFGDPRSDIWAVGALLFETLTGQTFTQDGRRDNTAVRLAQARMQGPAGDDDSLPKPISDILHRSLATDPDARYAEVLEMRKAVDTLLFSGDFTPTTFNLAFFMHSLFREDIEREARALKEEKEASYLEFLTEEPARTPPAARPAPPAPTPAPLAPGAAPPAPASAPPAPAPVAWSVAPAPAPSLTPSAIDEALARAEAEVGAPPPPSAAPLEPPRETTWPLPAARPAALGAREAAAGFTFHRDGAAPRKKTPLVAVSLATLVLIGAAAGYVGLRARPVPAAAAPATPAPTTLSPEAAAALARVKELEEKLQALEAEKVEAEAQAAEDARKKLEAQAAARGRAPDPAAVARAQEEARRRAQAEQERRLREEQERLEAEQRAAEERLAEERREDEAQAAALAAAAVTTTTTTLPQPPPAPATPAVRTGMLVSLSDPGVIAPVLDRATAPVYPPIALRQRMEGTVELNVLVDEKGNVADAQIVAGSGGKSGLNEAAVDSVKRRKYRPALKDGVPVKVWVAVRVVFRLP